MADAMDEFRLAVTHLRSELAERRKRWTEDTINAIVAEFGPTNNLMRLRIQGEIAKDTVGDQLWGAMHVIAYVESDHIAIICGGEDVSDAVPESLRKALEQASNEQSNLDLPWPQLRDDLPAALRAARTRLEEAWRAVDGVEVVQGVRLIPDEWRNGDEIMVATIRVRRV